jgi:hypothetical protein
MPGVMVRVRVRAGEADAAVPPGASIMAVAAVPPGVSIMATPGPDRPARAWLERQGILPEPD